MTLKNMHRRFAERALEPRYRFPEASLLIGRPAQTVRRWAVGNPRVYRGKRKVDEPLIRIDGSFETRDDRPLSFLNLLELRFLASYREAASLPAIRRALDFAAIELGVERPLLELEFSIQGKNLFLRFAEEGDEPYFVNASQRGQAMLPSVAWPNEAASFLRSLEYDDAEHAAYRWWPLGKRRPVMLDTRLNAGRPTTADSGVRTIAIATRSRSGWTPEEIAEDVVVKPDEIRAALELEHVAAAA
jgi:uncharacterized protein (DUF433 family)